MRDGAEVKSAEEINNALKAKIDDAGADELPRRADIQDLMKQNTPWNIVKRLGKAAIPPG